VRYDEMVTYATAEENGQRTHSGTRRWMAQGMAIIFNVWYLADLLGVLETRMLRLIATRSPHAAAVG
jgi:hypothetical protein